MRKSQHLFSNTAQPNQRFPRPLVGLSMLAALAALLSASVWAVGRGAQPDNTPMLTSGAARWANDHHTTAARIPFPAPDRAAWASFDLLSPDLAQYLASQGNRAAAVVYDLTRQQYYGYHPDNQYLMGHSVRLPILMAFLAMTEQQHRRPGQEEMKLLTAMMENADEDAGEQIYDEIGRGVGLAEYIDRLGITGLEPDNCEWMYSFAKPLAMVQLLTLLDEGKVLTPQDRQLVFSLLEPAAPNQQIGVGDTRPQGAAVAVKDGWVLGTDNRWAMNTSGIVTVGSETYIIAVYSAHLDSLEEGQTIVRQVSARVAALLP